jgi:hypothetical protein
MARKPKYDSSTRRWVDLHMRLEADEDTLQRLAAIMLLSRFDASSSSSRFGPDPMAGSDQPPPVPSDLLAMPVETMRAEILARLRTMVQQNGPELARRTLLDHGGDKVSTVPEGRLPELLHYLREAQPTKST